MGWIDAALIFWDHEWLLTLYFCSLCCMVIIPVIYRRLAIMVKMSHITRHSKAIMAKNKIAVKRSSLFCTEGLMEDSGKSNMKDISFNDTLRG